MCLCGFASSPEGSVAFMNCEHFESHQDKCATGRWAFRRRNGSPQDHLLENYFKKMFKVTASGDIKHFN